MIKAIIFDFFNVIQTDPFHAWLRGHGYKLDDEPGRIAYKFNTGHLTTEGFFIELAQLSGQTAGEVGSEFEEHSAVNQAVIDFIVELKSQFKLGLLSNSGGPYLRGLLKRYNIETFFDEIVVSGEVGIAKPDQKIFALMLERLGVNPGEAVFIDDQMVNVEAAKATGLQSLLFKDIEILRHELDRLTR